MKFAMKTSERIRVIQNPVWVMPSLRKDQFRWQVYCDCCDSADALSLFWGACLGGTNDWNHAVRFAQEHARSHRRCGECGQIETMEVAR